MDLVTITIAVESRTAVPNCIWTEFHRCNLSIAPDRECRTELQLRNGFSVALKWTSAVWPGKNDGKHFSHFKFFFLMMEHSPCTTGRPCRVIPSNNNNKKLRMAVCWVWVRTAKADYYWAPTIRSITTIITHRLVSIITEPWWAVMAVEAAGLACHPSPTTTTKARL